MNLVPPQGWFCHGGMTKPPGWRVVQARAPDDLLQQRIERRRKIAHGGGDLIAQQSPASAQRSF
jgi:hypothetical protein